MSSHRVSESERAFGALRHADAELVPLMRQLQQALAVQPIDLGAARAAIIAVLEFLCSPRGRTDANCTAVDTFFHIDDSWLTDQLPEDYHDIVADMGGQLHDTFSAPYIAQNFDSTPEQLLARARDLQ